jgi:hypothetical protein
MTAAGRRFNHLRSVDLLTQIVMRAGNLAVAVDSAPEC